MLKILILIIYISNITHIKGQVYNSNKFILQSSLVYQNCQNSEISRDIEGQTLMTDKYDSNTKSLKIKGWFFFKSQDPLERTLISIHQSSSFQVIANLSYRVAENSFIIKFEVAGKKLIKLLSLLNLWAFISIQFNIDNNNLQSLLSIFYSSIYTQTNDTALNEISLNLKNLIINIGSPSQKLIFQPSCVFTKDIRLYQNYPYKPEDTGNLINDSTSIETYLFYFFEFYSIALTPNLLQSQGIKRNQVKLQNLSLKSSDFNSIDKLISIPIINLKEISNFILTFDAKLLDFPKDGFCKLISFKYITQNSTPIEFIQIKFNDSNEVVVNNKKLKIFHNYKLFWTQINLSVSSLLNPRYYAWLDDNLNLFKVSFLTQLFSLVQITFGSMENSCSVKINNIKLFTGNQIEETQSCKAQVGEDKQVKLKLYLYLQKNIFSNIQYCLRCDNTNLLNQSDQKMRCQSDGKPSEINYIQEQIREQCPKNMYFFEEKCKCLKGFYLDNNICKRCPRYCLGCTDFTSCNNNNYNRNSIGRCINKTFDDGFSCIKPIQDFDFKSTLILPFPEKDLSKLCSQTSQSNYYTYSNQVLNIQKTDTLFYSFSISKEFVSRSIFSVFNVGSEEIFTLFFEEVQQIQYVKILIRGQKEIQMQIKLGITVWIGVWTDLKNHMFLIHSNGQTIYKTANTEQIEFNELISICVGKCLSQFITEYICKINLPLPLLVVKGIQDLISYGIDNIFFYHHSNDSLIIAKYIYNDMQSKSQIIDTKNRLDFTMQLSNSSGQFDKIKGIGFTTQIAGKIDKFNTVKGFITFQCSIQIDSIEDQILLLSYDVGQSLTIRYYLFPEEFNQYASIRICINQLCGDAKYIKIEIQIISSLIIIPKDKAPYESEIKFFEFNIISNYQSEAIALFSETSLDLIQDTQNIQFSSLFNNNEYLVFLNYIKFYQSGHFFYIDYRESEGCFIFININPKICINLKQGYYNYENIVISYQQCQDLNESSEYFYYANPYSQECEITNIQIKKCKEIDYNGESYFCRKCKDPYAILNLDPEESCFCNSCKDGYFYSQSLDKCLICHNKCSKCSNTFDNCTECAHDEQLTPSCQCVQPNYYLDTDYICKQCEVKYKKFQLQNNVHLFQKGQCQSCEQEKSYCIKCSENRIYPPLCICSQGYEEDLTTKECKRIRCLKKCQTCIDTPSKCDICAQNRIQQPDCICGVNYFEDKNGDCQLCPQSTYYDITSQLCKNCSFTCTECEETKDKCKSCKDGFLLKENTCTCQNKNVPFVNNQGQQKCLDHMFLNFEIRFFQKFYSLIFLFDEELLEIDFQHFQIKDILTVYLSQTPQDSYQITNPQITGRQFSVDIKVQKNISTQQGNILFLDNKIFVSKSEEYAMSDIYTQKPINFKIGPFIFKEEVLAHKQLDQVNEAINKIDPYLLDLIQKFQFAFYILNTLQPTIIFFLLNLQFPPNLYKFYQMVGSFVFQRIPNYQSYTSQIPYQIFNYQFDKNEVQPAKLFQFYGFSDCLIVNIPIILIKFAVILLGMIASMILSQILFVEKQINTLSYLKIQLFQLFNTENEVNVLAITLSIMIQFFSVNQLSFMNRMSVYLTVIILLILLGSLIFNIQQVNQEKESQYSTLFTERLKNRKNRLQRNYFIFQLIKKYSVVITVFSLQSFPLYTCAFNGGIFLISSLSTILLNPYLNTIQKVIKFKGDFILSILWFFHIYLVYIESQLFENNIIEDELIDSYLRAGNVVIIALLVYNFIYLIEFFVKIIQLIKDIKKPVSEKEKEKNLNKLIITHQSHYKQNYSKIYLKKNNVQRPRIERNQQNKRKN